jgi:regulatory protein
LTQLGHPVARIRGTLLAQGLAKADIEAALSGLAEELGNVDVAAAAAYARRRRLGPWRPENERGAWRERDMMRLARAGFNYSLARTIVDAASADDLIEQLMHSPEG